jgi:4-hydroxy-3-methylbut-2-enyl diphosphate reductase IspH
VILVGHAGHPEVEGTMGSDAARYCLQTCGSRAPDLHPTRRPRIYPQTTLSVDVARAVIAGPRESLHPHRRPGRQ